MTYEGHFSMVDTTYNDIHNNVCTYSQHISIIYCNIYNDRQTDTRVIYLMGIVWNCKRPLLIKWFNKAGEVCGSGYIARLGYNSSGYIARLGCNSSFGLYWEQKKTWKFLVISNQSKTAYLYRGTDKLRICVNTQLKFPKTLLKFKRSVSKRN